MNISYLKNKLKIKEEKVLFLIQAINFEKLDEINYLLKKNKYKDKDIVLFFILSFNKKNKNSFNELVNSDFLYNGTSKSKIQNLILKQKIKKNTSNKNSEFLNSLNQSIGLVTKNELKNKIENF
jgi:hypothetical protein